MTEIHSEHIVTVESNPTIDTIGIGGEAFRISEDDGVLLDQLLVLVDGEEPRLDRATDMYGVGGPFIDGRVEWQFHDDLNDFSELIDQVDTTVVNEESERGK